MAEMSTATGTPQRKPRKRRATTGITRKLVISGSTHQKAALLIGHYAAAVVREPPTLTPEEEAELVRFFQSDGIALATYERYREIDQAFRLAYIELSGRASEYELVLARIQFVQETIRGALSKDQLLVSVSKAIAKLSDPKTAAETLKQLEPLAATPYASTEIIQNLESGTRELRILPFNQLERLKALFKHRASILMNIKTWITVIRRTIDSHSFNIKPYIEFLDRMEQRVKHRYTLVLLSDDRIEELKQQAEADSDDNPMSPYRCVLRLAEETRIAFQEYDEIEPTPELLTSIGAFFYDIPTVYGGKAK
jgi:hypothetical protein